MLILTFVCSVIEFYTVNGNIMDVFLCEHCVSFASFAVKILPRRTQRLTQSAQGASISTDKFLMIFRRKGTNERFGIAIHACPVLEFFFGNFGKR